MRIISGKHRGRKLSEFSGEEIRPTSDRVKECLFNILSTKVSDAIVLDLFCGSGSLGLECISRGAKKVHFNDLSADSLKVLKKNLNAMGESDCAKITNLDYLACLRAERERFDIIFLDPPYRLDYGVPALKEIANGLLNGGGVVVYERDRSFDAKVDGLEKFDERKYGKTYLTFFRAAEPQNSQAAK